MGSRSELRDLVRSQLEILLAQKNFEGAKTLLRPVQEVDIAEAIEGLPQAMQVIAFRLLPKAEAIEVYEHLGSDIQQSLIEQFRDHEALELVENMSPDDRASLFDELPPRLVRRMLSQLSAEERRATSLLLGYQPNTAGRLMTPEFISLKADLSVAQAQAKVREKARDAEISYYLYVTDAAKKLVGTVSFRDLVLAYPDQLIGDIMGRDVVYADTDTDQEEVAELIQRYDLLALPVVDREQNLLGVVTVDDALDIVQEEVTEDIYKMGGVQPAAENYFQSGLLAATQQRIPWLVILLLTNAITILILSRHADLLSQLISLTFFAPLLIDAGGNVGAQSSTVVIRGLSTDELRYREPVAVILRELLSGGLLGLMLGVLALILGLIVLGQTPLALIVGGSLVAIAAVAAALGAALPFLFKALGYDPALMSAPFITTVVDVVGLVIYLGVAEMVLG
jgi:magnesium transporter